MKHIPQLSCYPARPDDGLVTDPLLPRRNRLAAPPITFLRRILPAWIGIALGILSSGMTLAQEGNHLATDTPKAGGTENTPLFPERILFNWHNFLSSCSTWNLADWQRWTEQAQKLGYNAIMVHAYASNPMAGFTFQGKQRPIGYLTTTAKGRDWGTMHVNDVRRLVGGNVFDGPVFGSDAALVPDEQRVQSARKLMGQVFADAAQRGMGIYFAVDMDTAESNPQELITLLPESARFQNEKGHWLANPDTPEGYAYYKAAVRSWMQAYPQITTIAVWARHEGTAWMALDKAMPAVWRKEYEAEMARVPQARDYRFSTGHFAYAKVARAVERALKECGAVNTKVAVGSWGFDFLPAFDAFLPGNMAVFGLDYDALFGAPQLATAKGRAALAKVGANRPVIPVIWAHHDDGQFFGRSYTPFSEFAAKLTESKVAGFGVIHWMTRPLDLFFAAHARQVFSATRDEPLRASCDWFAAQMLQEPQLGEYLFRWITEAPQFGRDTTDFFIKTRLTNQDSVIAGCRDRLKLLENATGKNAAYFKGLEAFIIAFYQTQTKYQECVTAYRRGDVAAARAAIGACNPEEVIRQYVAFSSIGEMTPGEKGLLVSLNTRWLVYFHRMRQLLGLAPVRINFGPTAHDKLAQQPGQFTYFFDAGHQIWQTFGTEETQAETFAAPLADHEIGRSGLIGNKPFTVEARPLAQRDDLPAGRYRLKLLFLDPDSTAEGQRIFKVTAEPIVLCPQWSFEPVKAAFLRLKCHGTDKGDWNSLCEVSLPGLLQSEPDRVTASGAAEGFPAKNLVDGNVETRWAAQGRDHWVQFRLDPHVAVNRIGLVWYGGDTRNPKFEIETSVDGEHWTPVANLKRAEKGAGAEMTIDVFQKAGKANQLVEWEMPVALQQPGIFQITLTPVKGEAVISGLVLDASADRDGEQVDQWPCQRKILKDHPELKDQEP